MNGVSSESGLIGAVLGVDGGPAALGLHRAVTRLPSGLLHAEPRAMGHLVEAVPEGLRADLERLEEDGVLRVSRH